ncbi:NtaA/DmoA family FMN-dependent monooxygenase [Bradyrhizobium sp. 61]|nr:NtaA/DmoA family FMN-dependent monooxygenase [Bradyrhizobium sp. 61]MCK1441688.1 NtaA/DmoA family FMN-dependent monooxygenase [Bradyrhizobium sp. 48]MCK1465230.1 NtaA/DmoA family FMN-dependent monooxygenase [Bradyrhizobium sp. 2]
MMSKRELHFGLMFWAGGTHPSGWRYPSSHAGAAFDIEFLQHVTQLVEAAKFDFLFLGDRLASDPGLQTTNPSQMSRLEPFVSGASLAAATSHIGIVVTANPTYYDPYNLARMFASLDHLSEGRASWNLVTGADAIAAGNFSREAHWDTERRYDWADEFVTVVRGLWDSDAITPLHHKGRYFDVAGPLNIRRPPQGHPIILHAGTSDRSRELGARDADVIFAGQATIESAKAYYADVKSRAAKYGRKDADIPILPGLTPVVAETTAKAVEIYDHLNSFIALDPEGDGGEASRYGSLGRMGKRRNLTAVSALIGVDIAGQDRDAPVDPLVLAEANEEGQRLFAHVTRLTRRDVKGARRLTYRDLIIGHISIGATVVGDPIEVADHIQLWFDERAADGFNIFPPYVPESVEAFTGLVVPELQRRGLYRTEYSGSTFRDHLGLAKPASVLSNTSSA